MQKFASPRFNPAGMLSWVLGLGGSSGRSMMYGACFDMICDVLFFAVVKLKPGILAKRL